MKKDTNEFCAFCKEIEITFHMFLECKGFASLLIRLEDVFSKNGVHWSEVFFMQLWKKSTGRPPLYTHYTQLHTIVYWDNSVCNYNLHLT